MASTRERVLVLQFEGAQATAVRPGLEPARTVRVLTPGSRHIMRNKSLVDATNNVIASGLTIGGEYYTFAGASDNDVMQFDGATVVFGPQPQPALGVPTPYGKDVYSSGFVPQDGTAFGYESNPYNAGASINSNTGFGRGSISQMHTGGNTGIGTDTAVVASFAYGQVAIGYGVGAAAVSPESVAIGFNSRERLQSVVIGPNAYRFGTANYATVYGFECAGSGDGGMYCSMFGYGVGMTSPGDVTVNRRNTTAFGIMSLWGARTHSAVTDTDNGTTVFGTSAGENSSITQASETGHTLCGAEAGLAAINWDTTALGRQAMRTVQSAGCCGMGYQAGYHTWACPNTTSIGFEAGPANNQLTAHDSTHVGYRAQTTGNNGHGCIVIGANSTTAAGAVGAIAIGNNITNAPSGQLTLGSATNPLTMTSTVGAAGAADAVPATPATWLRINVNGTAYVTPLYAGA